jgi:hypothetical protein
LQDDELLHNPGTNGAKFDYGYRGTPIIIALGFDASKAVVFPLPVENGLRWAVLFLYL